RGTHPIMLPVRAPSWASRMIVDVDLAKELWNTLTDFGVTVFDSAGQQIGQGPMNYSLARQIVKVDSLRRGRRLEIELHPAFAHLKAPDSWSARVRVSFVADRPVPVDGRMAVNVPGGASASIAIPPAPPGLTAPDGFQPLL